MARDRRRAKQRRERQARSGGGGQGGRSRPDGQTRAADPTAPAGGNGVAASGNGAGAHEHEELHEHEAPELASGEVDLAEARLAMGRPDAGEAADLGGDDEPLGGSATGEVLDSAFHDDGGELEEDRVAAAAGAPVARSRERAPATRGDGNRLANFLRGSWRELQRVQWPDRRQVAQATAVVIGFVFVAGAFLGLMDYVASKIVDLIV